MTSMTNIEGYQDKQVKQQESTWRPSFIQVLVYLGASLLVVAVAHRSIILNWLGGDALQSLGGIRFLSEGEDYYLSSLFAVPVLGTIAVVVFWAAIGCTLYCLAWGLTNTIREAKKYEEASEDSVMPEGQTKQKFWASSVANITLLVSSVFVFILLLSVAFGYALQASGQLLTMVLTGTLSSDGLLAIAIFIIGSIVIGHGLYLSWQTFQYARKVTFF